MSSIPPTPMRPRDRALRRKHSLRLAMETFGLSTPQLANMLGIEDDLLEAILSPTRPNHVPAWFEDDPNFPKCLRDFMRAESDRCYGEPAVHGADTPEVQAAVTLRSVGQFLIVLSPVISVEHIGGELAEQLLVTGEKLIAATSAFMARLRKRVVTAQYAARTGASS